MSTSQSLPLYQCHKQVRAIKIKEVLKHAHPDPKADDAAFESSPAFQGAHLIPIDERLLPIAVDEDWYRKHSPQSGGYYVVYEDGYTSYSPAAAFESGYSPVLAMAQQNSRIESAGAMVGTSASISGQPRISHREELECVLVSGASAQIAHEPDKAAAIAKGIKTVLDELAPVAPHPVAIAPLPVIDPGPNSLEREIQAKADKGLRVTPAALQAEIASAHYFTGFDGAAGAAYNKASPDGVLREFGFEAPPALSLLTFCVLVLRNGFTVIGHSACASPENYNAEIGERIARENAERQIWPLLGFRLRDELARPVLTEADALADLAGEPRPS